MANANQVVIGPTNYTIPQGTVTSVTVKGGAGISLDSEAAITGSGTRTITNLQQGIYTVIGTQTAATGTWTGALHNVSALYDGLTIMYYLPYNGSGNATLNLTLDNGTTTGAVNCYYHSSRLTTHYSQGSNIVMTYWSAGSISVGGTATTDNRWIANANYADGNDNAYQLRDYYNRFKAGANKVFPYTIIMQCSDGRWESIVTSSSTGTSKARNTHGFRLGQIALMYANATYTENATIGDATIYESYTSGLVDHRYSFNTANDSTNGTTAVKPVYLVGALNATDGLFYLDTTWWTQTLPVTADGKLYIYLGDAYDYYRMSFRIHHPIYWYSNGKVREFNQDSATVGGYTIGTTSVGSASAGTAIAADDITAWTTNTPTAVTKKTVVTSATFNTVVTGGSTTAVPNISKKTVVTGVTKKTVVTSASGATASYSNGILTITDGSFSTGDSCTVTTGDSVTVGTAINAYTSLTTGASGSATTGDSCTVTAGTAASLSYTARSIPNISVSSTTVATAT